MSPKTPNDDNDSPGGVWGELVTQGSGRNLLTPVKSPGSVGSRGSSSIGGGGNKTPLASNVGGSHRRNLKSPSLPPLSSHQSSSSFNSLSNYNDGNDTSDMDKLSSLHFSSSTSNNTSYHSTNTTNDKKGKGKSRRFPLQHYSSASAVDLDAPIESYTGPVDLDESLVSDNDSLGGSLSGDTADGGGSKCEVGGSSALGDVPRSWSEEESSPPLKPPANAATSTNTAHVSDLPLTNPYTNDETMNEDSHDEYDDDDDDDSTHSGISIEQMKSGESSIMAMSVDESEVGGNNYIHGSIGRWNRYNPDNNSSSSNGIRNNSSNSLSESRSSKHGSSFNRIETDDSALDDEDYYKQDYYLPSTSKSLSERVLMNDGTTRRLTSREVLEMTEPALPVGEEGGVKILGEDLEEGGDYGDFYNDTEFPVVGVSGDGEEGVHQYERSDDDGDSTADVDDVGMDDGNDEQPSQDIIEQPVPVLPDDEEFEEVDNNVAGGDVVESANMAEASAAGTNDDVLVETGSDIGDIVLSDDEADSVVKESVAEDFDVAEEENSIAVGASAEEVKVDHITNDSEHEAEQYDLSESEDVTNNILDDKEEFSIDREQPDDSISVESQHVVPESVNDEPDETEKFSLDGVQSDDNDSLPSATREVREADDARIPSVAEGPDASEEFSLDGEPSDGDGGNIVQIDDNERDGSNEDCKSPTIELVRSSSDIDSPPHMTSPDGLSPRRHSLGSMYVNHNVQPEPTPKKTPHKEVTDNLMAMGVMSLFMGGGGLGRSSKKKTPMKTRPSESDSEMSANTMKPLTEEHVLKEESPGLWSVPSLASPSSPSPAVNKASSALSTRDDAAVTPEAGKSMLAQFDEEMSEEKEVEVEVDESTVEQLQQFTKAEAIKSFSSQLSVGLKAEIGQSNERNTDETTQPLAIETTVNESFAAEPTPRTSHKTASDDKEKGSSRNGTCSPLPLLFRRSDSDEHEDPTSPLSLVSRSADLFEGVARLPQLDETNVTDQPPQSPRSPMKDYTTLNLPVSPTNSKAESIESMFPDFPHDVNKIIRENRRLRVKRQQLCESLSSMAQQFAAHESTSSEKIFSLEQKIQALVAEKEQSVIAPASYDGETVRRLSSGVLNQEKQLESKDMQISQLKLRCEVLKRTLHDKEEDHHQNKKLWDDERKRLVERLHNHISSPERQGHLTLRRELLEAKMECAKYKKDLDNAISDINALTEALETNNEALDKSVAELEKLRKWKSEHDNATTDDAIDEPPTISRTSLPTLSYSPSKMSSSSLPNSPYDANWEQSDHRDESTDTQSVLMHEKDEEIAQLQRDLESSLNELDALRESAVPATQREYHDLQNEVQLLQNEAKASRLEAKLANDRIAQILEKKRDEPDGIHESKGIDNDESSMQKARRLELEMASTASSSKIAQLESELEAKRAEIDQLRATVASKDSDIAGLRIAAETVSVFTSIEDEKVASEKTKSLEDKIASLEQKLTEYERGGEDKEDPEVLASDDNPVPDDGNDNDEDKGPKDNIASILSPKSKNDETEVAQDCELTSNSTGDLSKVAASPLQGRRLFQLHRGWKTSPPLNRNTNSEPSGDLLREHEAKIAELDATVKANIEVMEKLKRDIVRIQSEREEADFVSAKKIETLLEENTTYALQVSELEKLFMTLNAERISDASAVNDPVDDDKKEKYMVVADDGDLSDDGSAAVSAADVSQSAQSEKTAATQESANLRTKNMALQRTVEELENSRSFQEDQIEQLKIELVKLRVSFQQEKDLALEDLQNEVAIVTSQRSALENQLVEINKSAGLLRQSLADQSPNSYKRTDPSGPNELSTPKSPGNDGVAGDDPVLVAQVVMLENANRVLESQVNSLRSDMQQKLAPLLERIALLEEEKRISEDEMNAKLECREMTITNLENSLQQMTSSRLSGSAKKKRQSKMSSPLKKSISKGDPNKDSAEER